MNKFGLSTILAILAGFTIITASLIALKQENLKMRLAYSTVGHLSYIVLGAALISTSAFTGAMLHILFHATMKITLFFVAGAIYINLHKENISELNGIGRVMPWSMGAFAIGSIGLAGIPPVNGFISKWYLIFGSIESGQLIFVFVLIISGLLNVAYLFPIVYLAFFKKGGKELEGKGEAPLTMVVPIVCTAILSILFGIYPDIFFNLFKMISNIAVNIMGS